jgi:hypothetical protein
MQEEEIPVTKEEQFVTYRQVVTPEMRETIPEILTSLHSIFAADRMTGKITVNYMQGGVPNILTEQIARIRPGSEADELLEEEFKLPVKKAVDKA